LPWQDVVRKTDSRTTLFMADPPYFPGTVARDYYAHSMTAEEHEEMVSVLAKAKGLVILSGYPNDLYDKTLANWRRIDFGKETTMGVNGKRGARMETLWMNFDDGGKKLRR
jgi:DNA adenine methylase